MVLVWEPITDLPENWSDLTDGELGPLLQFWKDQRSDLEESGALAEFNTRLSREWSIETGQIEGVYNLDRGITETLIEKGINADLIPQLPGQRPPEIIAAIIQDHTDVLNGLFTFVKGDRPLSKSYIHELHAALLRHQETAAMRDQFGNLFEARLLKGKYKERPNNPKKPDGSIHQYCPPEQVDPEMERLLALHEEHEKKGVPVEIEAAWLHHRFTQIHPYQDGNGRVARALASLLFIRAGWFPVVVTREERARYIDALEVADEGDLRSFVLFITQIQRRSLLKTFQSAAEIRGVHSIDEALEAAKHALKSLGRQTQPTAWMRAKETADRLLEIANSRMAEIAASLNEEIARNGPAIEVILSQGPYNMATELQLPYTPNRTDYQQSLNLEFRTLSPYHWADAEIQAHAMGSTYRGLIGMVAVFVTEANTEMLSPELFQVNYLEPYESAERRFRPWLEESLVKALILWRKSL